MLPGPRSRGARVHARPCQGCQPCLRTSAASDLELANQEAGNVTGQTTGPPPWGVELTQRIARDPLRGLRVSPPLVQTTVAADAQGRGRSAPIVTAHHVAGEPQ